MVATFGRVRCCVVCIVGVVGMCGVVCVCACVRVVVVVVGLYYMWGGVERGGRTGLTHFVTVNLQRGLAQPKIRPCGSI